MWGRIIGLAAGVALLAEGYVLWRPEDAGFMPTPDLGPYTQYRLVIALLAAVIGAMVVIASLLRDPRQHSAAPLDLGSEPEPWPTVAHPVDLDEQPHVDAAPAVEHPAEPAHVHTEAPAAHIDEADHGAALDPFPAVEHGPAEAHPAPIATVVEASASPPTNGDRGAFLAAMDEGDQLRAANRLGDAIDPYSEALRLARARVAASPQDPATTRDLACALSSVADVHDREGRLDSALDLHGESLAIRRILAAQAPGDVAAQRALSTGLEKLADTREARGHRSRARDLFRERLPLAERLAAGAPGDSALAQDLSITRARLAELDEALAPSS